VSHIARADESSFLCVCGGDDWWRHVVLCPLVMTSSVCVCWCSCVLTKKNDRVSGWMMLTQLASLTDAKASGRLRALLLASIISSGISINQASLAHVLAHNFLPAPRYASAGLCKSNVSFCPSACLSHAGIVSKRRKPASWFLHLL